MMPSKTLSKGISRTKVDLFLECAYCFYLYRLKGISRPKSLPFSLNNAVDNLLKVEFDSYRKLQMVHPLVAKAGLSLVPFDSPLIDDWRTQNKGVRVPYKNFEFFGLLDDVWQDTDGKLVVVDYKATAKKEPVTKLEPTGFHLNYRRQLEFYVWLLTKNGFEVSSTAWLYYCTGDNTLDAFNEKLSFRTNLISHQCDTTWIEPVLDQIIDILDGKMIPTPSSTCEHCSYYNKRNNTSIGLAS